jgi:hypothetical protein
MANALAVDTKRANRMTVKDAAEAPVSTVFAFARNLGSSNRRTLADSEELHKSWLKLSDSAKKTMKLEFMIGYVTGILESNREAAETIINGRVRMGAKPTPSRPARTAEQQRAYDAARKMFSFHISRDDRRVVERTKPQQVKLSAEFKESAVAFVSQFYEEVNAISIGEVIKRLQALKQRIDKVLPEVLGDGDKAAKKAARRD